MVQHLRRTIASLDCGVLRGLLKPKNGLRGTEITDGQRLTQSLKLWNMGVMLCTFSIVPVGMLYYSGDCRFRWQKLFYFRVGLNFNRSYIICSDSSLTKNL